MDSMTIHGSGSPLANAIPVASGSSKKTRRLPQPISSKGCATRMLPQMPATSKRVPLIRRSDTEYSDHDSIHSAYSYRPGAISAIQYNEDYNYAYQSTDSLNTNAYSVLSEYGALDRRNKMAAISNAVPIVSSKLNYNQKQQLTQQPIGLASLSGAETISSSLLVDSNSQHTAYSNNAYDFRDEYDDQYSQLDRTITTTTTTTSINYYQQDGTKYGDMIDSSMLSRKRLPQIPQKLLPQTPVSTITSSITAVASVSTPRKRLPAINSTPTSKTDSSAYQLSSTWADDSLYAYDKKISDDISGPGYSETYEVSEYSSDYGFNRIVPAITTTTTTTTIHTTSTINNIINNNNNNNNNNIINNSVNNNLSNNNKLLENTSTDMDDIYRYNSNFSYNQYDDTYDTSDNKYETERRTYDNYEYFESKSIEDTDTCTDLDQTHNSLSIAQPSLYDSTGLGTTTTMTAITTAMTVTTMDTKASADSSLWWNGKKIHFNLVSVSWNCY